MYRFEIWFADLPIVDGSYVMHGCRPVVILSNNRANRYSPIVTVAPLTSKLKHPDYPSHVVVQNCGLYKTSMVLCEQIRPLDKTALRFRIGSITSPLDRAAIECATTAQLGMAA